MSLLERLEQVKQTAKKSGVPGVKRQVQLTPQQELKQQVQNRLIAELDSTILNQEDQDLKKSLLRARIEEYLVQMGSEMNISLSRTEHNTLITELLDDIVGLGPVQPLLDDEEVSEVMVNGPNQIYVERKGKLTLTDVKFNNDQHVMHIIQKIVSPLGRRIDESQPYVDARLKDGSRVNCIIPPLALNGPTITIRKFSADPLKISDLINFGSVTQQMADFLEACVKIHLNIVVSGGTGSGKTTLLNVLSSFIGSGERIITVEDAAEIQLHQPHWVRLETKSANVEGKGAVTMRDLIKNTLRMRPDRVIVGECRGGEALDMLQAMNTGHDGSLTTGHANTPKDMISRLETMVLMSGMDLPARAIREQIASAVHVIVQQSRFSDGSRRVRNLTEVVGMRGDAVRLEDVFCFCQTGVNEKGKIVGKTLPTGYVPTFHPKFASNGFNVPVETYKCPKEEIDFLRKYWYKEGELDAVKEERLKHMENGGEPLTLDEVNEMYKRAGA